MYVSWLLGDKLRIVMSSIMRWRNGEIGLLICGPLSIGLHERAILTDRTLRLQSEHVANADQIRRIVSDLSYAGDEGGIVCHIVPLDKQEALFISLTHVRMPRTMPLAAAVADYQKHRVKKLKKQGHV